MGRCQTCGADTERKDEDRFECQACLGCRIDYDRVMAEKMVCPRCGSELKFVPAKEMHPAYQDHNVARKCTKEGCAYICEMGDGDPPVQPNHVAVITPGLPGGMEMSHGYHEPLIVPCKPYWFDLMRLIQMTVYVARSWWEAMRKEDENVFVGKEAGANRREFLRRIMQGIQPILSEIGRPAENVIALTFDPTLWPPDEKGRYGRILRADFAVSIGPDHLPIEVDCGAPLGHCTALWSGHGKSWLPVNVFHVEYTPELPGERRTR